MQIADEKGLPTGKFRLTERVMKGVEVPMETQSVSMILKKKRQSAKTVMIIQVEQQDFLQRKL
jgi:hypothetical protein